MEVSSFSFCLGGGLVMVKGRSLIPMKGHLFKKPIILDYKWVRRHNTAADQD